jgi:hypothetical protein
MVTQKNMGMNSFTKCIEWSDVLDSISIDTDYLLRVYENPHKPIIITFEKPGVTGFDSMCVVQEQAANVSYAL